MSSKILIAYFSRPGNNYADGSIVDLPIGNTEIAARKLQDMTVGNFFKIDPVNKYSEDYHICTEEAQKELRANARPELSNYLDTIDGYDTIILGFPNWWGHHAHASLDVSGTVQLLRKSDSATVYKRRQRYGKKRNGH